MSSFSPPTPPPPSWHYILKPSPRPLAFIDSVAFVSDATLAIDFGWMCQGLNDPNSHHLETLLTIGGDGGGGGGGRGGGGGVACSSSSSVSGASSIVAPVPPVLPEPARAAAVAGVAASEPAHRIPGGGAVEGGARPGDDMWAPYRATGLTLKVSIDIAPEKSGDHERGFPTVIPGAARQGQGFVDGEGMDGGGGGGGDGGGSTRVSRPRALTREPMEGCGIGGSGGRGGGGGDDGGGGSGTRRHRRSESDCAGGRWGFGFNARGRGRGFFADRLFGKSRTNTNEVEDHAGNSGGSGGGGGAEGGEGGVGVGTGNRYDVSGGSGGICGVGLEAIGGGYDPHSAMSNLTVQVEVDPYGDTIRKATPPGEEDGHNHHHLDGPASCPERSFGSTQVGCLHAIFSGGVGGILCERWRKNARTQV